MDEPARLPIVGPSPSGLAAAFRDDLNVGWDVFHAMETEAPLLELDLPSGRRARLMDLGDVAPGLLSCLAHITEIPHSGWVSVVATPFGVGAASYEVGLAYEGIDGPLMLQFEDGSRLAFDVRPPRAPKPRSSKRRVISVVSARDSLAESDLAAAVEAVEFDAEVMRVLRSVVGDDVGLEREPSMESGRARDTVVVIDSESQAVTIYKNADKNPTKVDHWDAHGLWDARKGQPIRPAFDESLSKFLSSALKTRRPRNDRAASAAPSLTVEPEPTTAAQYDIGSIDVLRAEHRDLVAVRLEPFLGAVHMALLDGRLDAEVQAMGEHRLKQLLGELDGPVDPSAVVVRRYVSELLPVATAGLSLEQLLDQIGGERAGHVAAAVRRAETIAEPESDDKEEALAVEIADHLADALPQGPGRLRKVGAAAGWIGFRTTAGVAGAAAGAKLASEVPRLPAWGLTPGWTAVVSGLLAVLATFAPRLSK